MNSVKQKFDYGDFLFFYGSLLFVGLVAMGFGILLTQAIGIPFYSGLQMCGIVYGIGAVIALFMAWNDVRIKQRSMQSGERSIDEELRRSREARNARV